MKLSELTDEELLQKKQELIDDFKKTPQWSVHRRDINKAISNIERERLRRAWKNAEAK